MTFQELLEKHKKEDGSYDFNAAQNEYDEIKSTEFNEEKNKIIGNRDSVIEEKRQLQQKIEELNNKQSQENLERAKNNEDYKTLYESEKSRADKINDQYNNTTSKFKNSILEATVSSKLQEAGVQPHLVRLLKNDFISKADIVEDENGNFKNVAKVGNDNIDINEYINTTLQSDEYKPFLTAPQNSGGGASGSGSGDTSKGNPFSKENWDMSKQEEIYLKDPELAERLERDA